MAEEGVFKLAGDLVQDRVFDELSRTAGVESHSSEVGIFCSAVASLVRRVLLLVGRKLFEDDFLEVQPVLLKEHQGEDKHVSQFFPNTFRISLLWLFPEKLFVKFCC